MTIPEYVKYQILDHDITKVIEDEGIELKRQGANYECCCPFHGEKTPSFKVSPARNIYHCFGCGESGDAISFVRKYKNMTYVEALEYLAAKFGIQYEKREMTPEEREREFLVSQLMDVNSAANEYFHNCLKKSPGALKYIEHRGWSDETRELFGLGYAPEKGGLLEYMTGRGWKPEALYKAGLVKKSDHDGSYYDTFRHRIIFPVFGRTGYIAGFSGRYLGKKDVPKYLNTSDTELYKKSRLLFGWHQAYRSIATTGTAILVEGNPDVCRLHQIGQKNAVAPLGTALTKEQIDLMKTKARNVIIIGDTDNAGRAAVRKNSEALLRSGMNVSIIELPSSIGEKVDADSYFLDHAHEFDECMNIRKKEFVPWLCAGKMAAVTSQTEKAAVITEICSLMALVPDERTVAMYIENFSKEYKNAKIWNAEYYKAKNAIDREKSKDENTENMLQEYGFYVKDFCYYGAGNKANDRRWSNFILKPILHIKDEKNARRIFLMINSRHQEAVVKLNQSELVSFTDFKTRTETAGNYVWEAGQGELTSLKKYLYDDTPSADEIKQLGWQKKFGFYAWGNGGFDAGTFKPADKFGIIDIKGAKFYMPGCALDTKDNLHGYQQQRRFVYAVTNDISLRNFADKLIAVFGDNAKVALCFLIATLFKDIITDITTSFPILSLFGPKGTGKSELGHALTAFFVTNNIAPNINNTTKAALAEAVAEVSNAIVHLDEYKNNLDLEKREFLKGLWDGAGRSRMNMDNDKRRETTAVDCGVVMSGQEMPTADIALFNRLVFLTFSKSTFSEEEKRHFDELMRIEKRGLTHLTCQILMLRGQFQADFRKCWEETLKDMNAATGKSVIEERTLKNWATVLAAFKTIEGAMSLPFRYDEMLSLCGRLCIEQNNKTLMNNELAGFWEIVEILTASSKIWIEVDYRIRQGGKPVAIKESDYPLEFNDKKTYLFVAIQRVSQLYEKEGRETNGRVIPRETLKYYLEHSPEFMGTAKSVRFRLIENSQGYMSNSPEYAKSRVTTAMIFDYDALQENYGLNLDISGYYFNEPAIEITPTAPDYAAPSIFGND